jgi:hypothetical protein
MRGRMLDRTCWRGMFFGCFATIAAQIAGAQSKPVDGAQAKQYFDEARTICEKDAGKLWGKSLCAPMIFADPQSRGVVANQPDAGARLKDQDGVFVGELPQEINPANTSMTWAGTKWTMIIWPLPASPTARARLMMHELFHHLQDDLGLPGSNPSNAQLATLEGRVWLELEWRALQQALARPEQPPFERKRAVEDALLFRLQRRSLFPNAALEERELEMNEGLAEYTGYKLRGTMDAATTEAIINRLGSAADDNSFSRSFAYVSGPAYGMLLDLASVSWRKGLTPKSDLGELLRKAYAISLQRDIMAAANTRAAEYDGNALRWLETRKAEERQAALDGYKKRLIDGPVLRFPVMGKFDFSFDPNQVVPLDENTTVYPTLRVTDVWGVLEVSDGALMKQNQGKLVEVAVEAPKAAIGKTGEIEGPGWKLHLSFGWRLEEGERNGDLIITKE